MRKFEHNHVANTKWELDILPLCEHFQSVIGMTLANYSTVTQLWPRNDSSIKVHSKWMSLQNISSIKQSKTEMRVESWRDVPNDFADITIFRFRFRLNRLLWSVNLILAKGSPQSLYSSKISIFKSYQPQWGWTLIAGLFPHVCISQLSNNCLNYNTHKDGRSMRLFSGVRSTYLNWNSWVIPTESNKCVGKTRT